MADISGVPYSLSVKWTVPLIKIFDAGQATSSVTSQDSSDMVINSKLKDFSQTKLSPFYLELLSSFELKVKTEFDEYDHSVKLDYAFVAIKDSLFYLHIQRKKPLEYLSANPLKYEILQAIYQEQNDMTIYCRITIVADTHSSLSHMSHNTDSSINTGINVCESILTEPSSCTTCWETTTSSSANEALTKYLSNGELPNLNYELAKEMINEAESKSTTEMIALCAEYLKSTITIYNVVKLIQLAFSHNLKDLRWKCGSILKIKASSFYADRT